MIYMEVLDSEDNKKCYGSMQYPDMTSSEDVHKVLSLTMENFQVLGLGRYTISYNLTNYNFRSGSIVTVFPNRMTV